MSTEAVKAELSEPTLNQLRDRYARAIVERGVGLLHGQDLYIHALDSNRDLAFQIGEAAYDLGASRVHYRFTDRDEQNQLLRRAPALSLVAAVQVDLRAWYLEILRSRSPLLVLSDSSPSKQYKDLACQHSYKHDLYARGLGEISFSFMEQAVDQGLTACTIVPAPSAAWASRIFPELPAPAAERKLTELLVSVTETDSATYAERQEQDEELCRRLDALGIRTIQVRGEGNDLLLRLPETARWIHPFLETRAGQRYQFNFPPLHLRPLPSRRERWLPRGPGQRLENTLRRRTPRR
jgi:aminopeptidase